jgi:hypothetical protein
MDGIRPHKLGVGLFDHERHGRETWKSNDTRYFNNAMHLIVSPDLTCDELSNLAFRSPNILTNRRTDNSIKERHVSPRFADPWRQSFASKVAFGCGNSFPLQAVVVQLRFQ